MRSLSAHSLFLCPFLALLCGGVQRFDVYAVSRIFSAYVAGMQGLVLPSYAVASFVDPSLPPVFPPLYSLAALVLISPYYFFLFLILGGAWRLPLQPGSESGVVLAWRCRPVLLAPCVAEPRGPALWWHLHFGRLRPRLCQVLISFGDDTLLHCTPIQSPGCADRASCRPRPLYSLLPCSSCCLPRQK